MYSINACGKGKEGYVPVDSDLVGGIRGLFVQVTLVRGHVLGIYNTVRFRILAHTVRSSGKEARVCAFRMAERETVVRVRGGFGTKTCDVAVAGAVLSEDVIEAALGVGQIPLVTCETVGIEALYTAPATTLGVATPEEILFAVAVRAAMDGNFFCFFQIRLQMRQKSVKVT